MTDLAHAHAALQAALGPLGVEVGPEVLALWLDRAAHGREPLSADALKRLADLAQRLLADGPEDSGAHP